MMIKLQCKLCKFSFEVSEKEFMEFPEAYKHCYISCGGENEVLNLEEIVKLDIEKQITANIDKWVKLYGWDYVIDLVKKYKNYYAIGRLYVEELKKRGFTLKGE
jgi:hypothetical protein